MKISIALEEQLEEIEVHIRAARISEELRQIERALAEIAHGTSKLVFYKKETEYYLSLTDILFFETDAKTVYAHTAKDIYETKYRLYAPCLFYAGIKIDDLKLQGDLFDHKVDQCVQLSGI